MIEFIEHKGKKYPIRVGYIALKGFKAETGKGFTDMGDGVELEAYEPLLYHSLIAGCKFEEIDMPFKREEMDVVLDSCMMEFISLIPKFFPDNELGKQPPNRQTRRKSTKGKKKAP